MAETSKKKMTKPSFKPYESNNCWAVRFVYQGKQYSQGFGKGDQAKVNADIVASAISEDIRNDRFEGSISPYLELIPVEERTWRKSPRTPRKKQCLPVCKPYKGKHHNWTIKFVYRNNQYTCTFGKGDQAEINASIVADAILEDIKNDRFQNSITPYLDLIPVEQRTWRRKTIPRDNPELLKVGQPTKVKPCKPSPELLVLSGNNCLGCGSSIRVRNGRVNGKQRWKCLDCGRQRLENANYNFPSGKECYLCGRATAKKGKFKGVQRYWCSSCNAYWSDRSMPEVPKTIDWYNGGTIG